MCSAFSITKISTDAQTSVDIFIRFLFQESRSSVTNSGAERINFPTAKVMIAECAMDIVTFFAIFRLQPAIRFAII